MTSLIDFISTALGTKEQKCLVNFVKEEIDKSLRVVSMMYLMSLKYFAVLVW